MTRLMIGLVRLYQVTLSGLVGGACRFYPTCSDYAVEALRRHGVLRGSCMALRRIGKCHPFHPGGVDLVPPGPDRRWADGRGSIRAVAMR